MIHLNLKVLWQLLMRRMQRVERHLKHDTKVTIKNLQVEIRIKKSSIRIIIACELKALKLHSLVNPHKLCGWMEWRKEDWMLFQNARNVSYPWIHGADCARWWNLCFFSSKKDYEKNGYSVMKTRLGQQNWWNSLLIHLSAKWCFSLAGKGANFSNFQKT